MGRSVFFSFSASAASGLRFVAFSHNFEYFDVEILNTFLICTCPVFGGVG